MASTAVVALLVLWAEEVLISFPSAPVFRPTQPLNFMVRETILVGAMSPETMGEHLWPIANDGRIPLKCFPVCSGFGCRLRGIVDGHERWIDGKGMMIPPGGEADIVIEWRTGKLPGPFSNYAILGTSDPRFPQIRLTVEGSVRPTR
jgi:hypothetical protein